ncbi:hypothetical protein HGH93_29050 [Chitinophaga polysaccharea]|uniref:hypothetical protein n=1 Tax=Chitinophaga TaxID=79328 RepID=UPI0014556CAA|nr:MULTISPECIES: hypothetical protein [Chitinophaga]NLR62175.1 hypothetical protein [Chitinophaga polysaccharea]NLU95629.1 hypothetical protein [Chitinophaga sp. Ak27]
MLTKKNRVWAAVALLTGIAGFSSCLKSNNNVTPPRPQAQINILNVSNSPVFASFYDNDQRVSNDNTNISFNTNYRYGVYGGVHKLELKNKKGDSIITSLSANFDSTSYYTYIAFDNPVKSVNILSDFSSADGSKINIRCLNLSNGTDKIDFYIGGEKIDSNRNPMGISDLYAATKFVQFSNFSVNNVVTIKKAGTDVTLATANSSQLKVGSFNAGQVYTIYYAGNSGSTGVDKPVVDAIFSLYQ